VTDNNLKNKRVVFVIEALTVGGAEHMLVAMANRMQKLGWECSVICLTMAGDLAENLNAGINLQVLDKKPGADFSLPGRLRKCIQSIDPVNRAQSRHLEGAALQIHRPPAVASHVPYGCGLR